jgi:poly-gamma-glutamate capsule biosynthesis protein CapA/YwtB (metallophosphatase superfamily)
MAVELRMDRRRFLGRAAAVAGGFTAAPLVGRAKRDEMTQRTESPNAGPRTVTLFLCGDVMTGRGIDQILTHPSKPHLYEPYMRSALGYVEIAEQATGPIKRPVDFPYIWGDALAELERLRPDVRIINLETAVTAAEDAWPGKGIHYRMHPANVRCLTAARIDCCALANNHVLDWGYRGLAETLDTLRAAGLGTAGAGRDEAEAAAPAAIEVPGKGRVLVFAFGMENSGVPREWAARKDRAGVNLVTDLSARSAERVAGSVGAAKRADDIVVASIHWGGNWGYDIPRAQREFAHRLIEVAGVDVVHGHSSHHPKGIEVYRDKAILYGCGDFLNDYEGIGGYEAFRSDLGLMYFPTLNAATGKLTHFTLTPTRIRHFRVNRADERDARWLGDLLNREGGSLGTRVERQSDGMLALRWR